MTSEPASPLDWTCTQDAGIEAAKKLARRVTSPVMIWRVDEWDRTCRAFALADGKAYWAQECPDCKGKNWPCSLCIGLRYLLGEPVSPF